MPEDSILYGPNGSPIRSSDLPSKSEMMIEGSFMPDTDRVVPNANGMTVLKHLLSEQRSRSEFGQLGISPAASGVRATYYSRRNFVDDLYMIYLSDSVLRSTINHRRNETFRRGFTEWAPAFTTKCQLCNKKFDTVEDFCPECYKQYGKKIATKTPDVKQKEAFDEWSEHVNEFGSSLIQVLLEAHTDALLIDDCFIWLQKEYEWGYDHVEREWVLKSKLHSVRRLEPNYVEFDLDTEGKPLASHFVCPMDRKHVSSTYRRCPYCAAAYPTEEAPPMRPALYKFNYKNQVQYFTEDEIIHYSIFDPSSTYGWPPVLTIFEKELTLIGMDRWLYRYFYERKVPPGVILVNSDDPDSLRAVTDKMRNDMLSDPTNSVPIIGVNNKSGRGMVNFVRFFHSLQEMEYGPLREQLERQIGNLYGVSPIWQGVVEGVGGISGQSQQVEIMNRVVEFDQNVFNTRVIPKILAAANITDWNKVLKTPGQKTEETQLGFNERQAGLANTMKSMGFEIKDFRLENGDFVFEFGRKPSAQDPNAAGGGGMPGAPAEGGMGQENMSMASEGAENAPQNDPEAMDRSKELEEEFKNLGLSGNNERGLVNLLLSEDFVITKEECPPGKHRHEGIKNCHPEPPQPGSFHKDPKIRHSDGGNAPTEAKPKRPAKIAVNKNITKQESMHNWSEENIAERSKLSDIGIEDHDGSIEFVAFNDGTKAVYKYSEYANESEENVISYEISTVLGLNSVPATKLTDFSEGAGYLQGWVQEAVPAAAFTDEQIDAILRKSRKARISFLNMLVLDSLIDQTDRHRENWLIDKDANIFTIDNGLMQPGQPYHVKDHGAIRSDVPEFSLIVDRNSIGYFMRRGIDSEDLMDVLDNLENNTPRWEEYINKQPQRKDRDDNYVWRTNKFLKARFDTIKKHLRNGAMNLMLEYARGGAA